jgi:hypothetical protein
MRIPGSSRSSEITHRADVPPMPPSWLQAFHPTWRTLASWPAQTPVDHGATESSARQPEPQAGVQEMSAAASPGGGAKSRLGTPDSPTRCEQAGPLRCPRSVELAVSGADQH